MRDDLLVSIIIPVYNAAQFVEETIKSALNQTYRNIEIIIIDDASTDSSLKIVNQFKEEKIKIIAQNKNIGAAACRNIGIKNAKGDYIQFLDADDVLPQNKIFSQVELLNKYDDSILIGCYWTRFKSTIEKTIGSVHPQHINPCEIQDANKWLVERPMMIPHTWLVSKKLIQKAGLWDETLTLNDDGEFFYRVIAQSSSLVLSDAVVFYRSFQNLNLSSRNDRLAMVSWIKSAETYDRVLGSKNKDAQQSVENLYFQIAFSCLNKYDDLTKFCAIKLSKRLVDYHTEILLVENLKHIVGLKLAKKAYIIIHFLKNNKMLRKVFGKK